MKAHYEAEFYVQRDDELEIIAREKHKAEESVFFKLAQMIRNKGEFVVDLKTTVHRVDWSDSTMIVRCQAEIKKLKT